VSTARQPGLDRGFETQRARQLALLVESVTEYAIFALDVEGKIASWNRGAELIKGYREDEVIGRHFSLFYTEKDIAREHPAFELREAVRLGRYGEEGWRVRKDGTLFWASVVITALRDEKGRLTGFGKVTRDLTERYRAEEAQRSAAEELARVNEELRTFSSAAAHDLAEPLRTVRGFADILALRHADQLDERGLEFLGYVRSGAERMQRLIDHLLAYARAGTRDRALGPVDAGRAVRRVLTGLDAAIRERGAEVEADTEAMPTVRADAAGLELVLQNLLANALKFTSDRAPRVRIAVRPDPAGWRFEVADNGIGIPPELQASAFDPFRRVHAGDEIKGSGLGLAICSRIVEGFGGTIGVESEPGAGSTFHFTVPALDAAEAPAT
jgi:PAS domain S-box-containing protein